MPGARSYKLGLPLSTASRNDTISAPMDFSFCRYALDSDRASGMAGKLEDWQLHPSSLSAGFVFPAVVGMEQQQPLHSPWQQLQLVSRDEPRT